VLIIDIDKFTSLNSSLGFVLGDSLLLTIARRLQRHLGPNDTLGRISGDRFALMLLADQPVAELAQHAERIRRSLRSPIKIAGQEIVLTGSIGIAVYEGQDTSHTDLLKKAEIAMFRAKRAGADRIEVFTPEMRGDHEDRNALEADLRRALEKNQLRIAYYPVVYLPTEELAGFEAVAHWDHPQLGTIDPTSFAPFSEESDLLAKIGAHLLQRAARDIIVWQKEFPRADSPLFVAVNVSCRHLFRQDFVQEIRHILGRAVVARGSIRLEVTEQVALENPEQATEVLEWLRGAGAEIVLDEFGAGYSSLSYLDRLPFDSIKIDQAIMQVGNVKGGNDSALLRSMVSLAHELGKKVVAKGVEAANEVSFLRSIGCEYAQGAYCGDAIPEADVVKMLATVKASENKHKPVGVFRPKAKKKAGAKANGARKPDAAAAPPQAASAPPHASGGKPQPHVRAGASGGTNGTSPSIANGAHGGDGQYGVAPVRVRPERGNGGSVDPVPAPLHVGSPPPAPPSPAPMASQSPQLVKRLADVLPDVPGAQALPRVPSGPPPGAPSLRPMDGVPPNMPPAPPPPLPVAAVAPPMPAPHVADVPMRPIVVQPVQAMPPPQPVTGNGVTPFPPPLSTPSAGVPPPVQVPRPAAVKPAAAAATRPQSRPEPDFSNLPPAIAESLARLAGVQRKPN
jgi:diguanylate cyclase (GGDEF)-like protein